MADTAVTGHDADPLASSVSAYAQAAGHPVEADSLTPWLALIPVVFLELGSTLGLLVAQSLRIERAGGRLGIEPVAPLVPELAASIEHDAQRDVPGLPQPGDAPKPPATKKPRKPGGGPPARGQRLGSDVLALLKSRGGKIEEGQRGIARALGLSKSRVNEVLRDLSDAGAIIMAVSKRGTTLRLATA